MNAHASALSLDGRTVLITGAGDGIGKATALLCGQRGAAVVVVDRRPEAAQAVATQLRDRGSDAIAVTADVSNEADIDAAMQQAKTAFGLLHGIVNNAGIIVTEPILTTTNEQWDLTMNVNAKGVFLGSRAAVRDFLDNGTPGAIVNIGSISATVGLEHQAAYCASKGAVLQLSRQIAIDYAQHGIRCNVVSPGSVRTVVLDEYLSAQTDPAHARQNITNAHPLARLADPTEIAQVICFALSDAASFVTGANLAADGGYTAR